jgi:hypothetical protein
VAELLPIFLLRIDFTNITKKIEGSQIQSNSLRIVFKPHSLKNGRIPMGETRMGVHGKKYLVSSKGDNIAIPKPPLVNASRIPWVAVIRKKYTVSSSQFFEKIFSLLKKILTTKPPNRKAKNREWKKPLCPKK